MSSDDSPVFDRGKVDAVISGMCDVIVEHEANWLEAYHAARAVKASVGEHLRRAIGDERFSSIDK